MSGDGSKGLRELEAAVEASAARLAERERACARLECLYEIGQILLRFDSVENATPLVMSLAARDSTLRGAVLLTTERGPRRPLIWRATEDGPSEVDAALDYAAAAHAYFTDPAARSSSLLHGDHRRFTALPLAGGRGEISGTLLLEWGAPPGEPELAFAGALAHQLSLALDREAREEAIRQLHRQAQRAALGREDLLAMVAHELRNLLSVIVVDLGTLLRSPELLDLQRPRRQLLRIQRSSDRMGHLIQDLLDTASVEAESLSVEPRPLEVTPLLQEAVEAVSPLAATRSIHLDAHFPEGLSSVYADPTRLQQVFANLLNNAIKFSPDGGAITVRAEPSGDAVRFSVTDRGAGIRETDLPNLFHRFWKGSAAKGTGLGLFIVKGIVKAHGGRVWAESKVGAGSTFFFTVPVARGADPSAAH